MKLKLSTAVILVIAFAAAQVIGVIIYLLRK